MTTAAEPCDSCGVPKDRAATDTCADVDHRCTDATLGARVASCGCCTVVDSTALHLLITRARGLTDPSLTSSNGSAPDEPLADESLTQAWNSYAAAGHPPACPRCGFWNQLRLPACTDPGFSHAETCARTRYADALCAACEADTAADFALAP